MIHLLSTNLTIDHHTAAAISISGICLDVLGGLYLAYDLLGGAHGPLRLLTRMVTYSILFGLGYGLGFGPFFGIVAGTATGITIAIELQRAGRSHDHYAMPWEILFSAIRGSAFGAGLYGTTGLQYAVTFAVLITLGQAFVYARGMRPGTDYAPARKPHLTRRHFQGAIVRTIGYIATAMICSAAERHLDHAWSLALRLGLVTGLVTAGVSASISFVEYYADNLPERRLGAFGVWLVFCGFLLQSVQYWIALLDIHVI